ncbi:MAG: 2Fe-2S iron-sulfur cluster-binding protein [Planctomycetota bacterium]|jgi:NADPH-dependent glutamate synthase beta subunit-like oxidoreductase/ferredoxin
MIKLTIDNKEVQTSEGSTILEAAQSVGIHIPTLCYAKTLNPSSSCMVCVVRIEGIKSLVPACGSKAADKMVVKTNSDEIHAARKAAIELLLSDHVGDCLGPCTVGCPAKMNIPLMIRQIAAGDFQAAIQTVKKDIPLPAILGRICPAPCEKVCRRKQADDAVSICLLKRFVADMDLASGKLFTTQCQPDTDKKVAIVGAGPAGLSAAYYLKQAGIDCSIYDSHEKPGGTLRYGDSDRNILPLEVIEKEIRTILALGIDFQGKIRVGKDISTDELKGRYDAILLATGKSEGDKIQVDRSDYATPEKAIFAAGDCIGSRNLCIRAVADGKEAALSIQSFLLGGMDTSRPAYNHRLGKLEPDEMAVLMKQTAKTARVESQTSEKGLTAEQAQQEATRCLHCDCRKADSCQLREMANELNARQRTWQGEKKLFRQIIEHEQILFEPGKCIQCGLCIQMAQTEGEPVGLSFQGRGFDEEIAVPLNKSFACGLTKAAKKCVETCPTGALAIKEQCTGDGHNEIT